MIISKWIIFAAAFAATSAAFADPAVVEAQKRQGGGGLGGIEDDKLLKEIWAEPESGDKTKGKKGSSQRRMDEVDGGVDSRNVELGVISAIQKFNDLNRGANLALRNIDPSSTVTYPKNDEDQRPIGTKSPCPRIDIVSLGKGMAAFNVNGRTIGHMTRFRPNQEILQPFSRGQVALIPSGLAPGKPIAPIIGDGASPSLPCPASNPMVWSVDEKSKKISAGTSQLGSFRKFQIAQDVYTETFQSGSSQIYRDSRQAFTRSDFILKRNTETSSRNPATSDNSSPTNQSEIDSIFKNGSNKGSFVGILRPQL